MAFVLGLRDDLTRLARTVEQVRSVRAQVRARNALLKGNAAGRRALIAWRGDHRESATSLLRTGFTTRRPQVTYDILAMKGGTRFTSGSFLST